jgi:hypothetical protein
LLEEAAMSRTEAVRNDEFLEYLEERIKAKRAEYMQPGTSDRSRDILETEIAELRVVCKTYKERFMHDRGTSRPASDHCSNWENASAPSGAP